MWKARPCLQTAPLSQLLHDHICGFNGPAACLPLPVASVPDSIAPPLMFFVPLHNLLPASSCTSCPPGAGESSAVWLNTSLGRASDLVPQWQTPHVTNAIRGKYAITAIPTLSCGQTRTICQWGPSGIYSAWIGTCRYFCPCLLLQSCPAVLDVLKPREAWQRKMYCQRAGSKIKNRTPCLWLLLLQAPIVLWTTEDTFNSARNINEKWQ